MEDITLVYTESEMVGVYYNGKPIHFGQGDDIGHLFQTLGYKVKIVEVNQDCVDGSMPEKESDLIILHQTILKD